MTLEDIKVHYGAIDFNGALAHYVIHCHNPGFSWHQVENAAANFYIPFHKLSVFHHIKFLFQDPFSIDPSANIVVDSIHCEASQSNKHGTYIPGRFDTAIIKIESGELTRAQSSSIIVVLILRPRVLRRAGTLHLCPALCCMKVVVYRTRTGYCSPCIH